jgi:hypothetical protein
MQTTWLAWISVEITGQVIDFCYFYLLQNVRIRNEYQNQLIIPAFAFTDTSCPFPKKC